MAVAPPAASPIQASPPPMDEFDDQPTEVDLPRGFIEGRKAAMKSKGASDTAGTAPPASSRGGGAARRSGSRPDPLEAFAPRRSAPVVGAPLRPPLKSPFVDETATEIMSAAVRAQIPEPGSKKKETNRPPPPRPPTGRPPPRR